MTGPEAFTTALEFLESAAASITGSDIERYYLKAAAVYASLAQTAATVEAAAVHSVNGTPSAWRAVLRPEREQVAS